MITAESGVHFQQTQDRDFYTTLKKRIDDYFKSKKVKKTGNYKLYFKTVCMFALYLTPFILILYCGFNPWIMLLLCILVGVGKAGVGFSVQHDANHGAYSSKKWVNTVFGYGLNFIGGCAFMWRIQHNIYHHTYTNIFNADEDINAKFVLRLSPSSKRYFFHRLQFIYAPFFYGLLTLTWVFYDDFNMMIRHFLIHNKRKKIKKFVFELSILGASKAFYLLYTLVLPMMLLDLAWWQVCIGFFAMHFTTGLILSFIFQLAHVVKNTQQPIPNPLGKMETSWAVHQMKTTADFCKYNRLISWYIGGLNFQVEHHLFSHISHIHYKHLSGIVKKTASDFNIPYLYFPTFMGAIKSHFQMLYLLGKKFPSPQMQQA